MIITGGEKYKGRRVQAPDEKITRPTLSKVRMGVFNVLYSLIGDFEGKNFLDMFGGFGIMGLEALSRGFSNVVVFEKNQKVAQVLKNNYKLLGLVPNLYIGDSLKLLDKVRNDFDVIYVDPPYMSGIYECVFEKLRLESHQLLLVEHSEPISANNLTLIKTKNYGGKMVSFFKP